MNQNNFKPTGKRYNNNSNSGQSYGGQGQAYGGQGQGYGGQGQTYGNGNQGQNNGGQGQSSYGGQKQYYGNSKENNQHEDRDQHYGGFKQQRSDQEQQNSYGSKPQYFKAADGQGQREGGYGKQQSSYQGYQDREQKGGQSYGDNSGGYKGSRPQTGYQGKPRFNDDQPSYNEDRGYGGKYGGQAAPNNYPPKAGPAKKDYSDPEQSCQPSFNEEKFSQQKMAPSSSQASVASSVRPPMNQPQKAVASGPGNFSSKPVQSATAKFASSALVPMVSNQQVKVMSNQYRLKLGGNMLVYQYKIEILGMEMWDANLVQQICRFKRKALETALGMNVVSGSQIYTLQELEENVDFPALYQSAKYTIVIDKATQCQVQLNESFQNSQNTVAQNLLNIIIKEAFRSTELKQIGKAPRFFDVKNPIDLSSQGLKIWSGFKASAFQSQMGCTLVMDSIFKFMSTKTCLQRILEIKDESPSQSMWEQRVKLEFSGKSIIADWGNQRTYFVTDVVFDQNPVTCRFVQHDQEISVADYFLKSYKKKITMPKQPLFLIKVAENSFHLPTEFCLLDGVPDSVRKSAGMRDALAQTRVRPDQKMDKIKKMVKELFQQKAIKDWDLIIEPEPILMDTSVLNAPQIISGNQLIRCDEQSLRKLPIQKAVHLKAGQWVMVYENTNQTFGIADKILNDFYQASKQLKLDVEEPHFIEMKREDCREELEFMLQKYMMGDNVVKHPTIVVCVLNRERNYQMYKEVMQSFRMPSQVVTTRNGRSFNLSKATNILRQINSKAGGDLYTLKFPDAMANKRNMLIGIDVCHAGPQSIVGFSASINPDMSQYYSDYLIQKKGQEIVQDKMKEVIEKAIKAFAEQHSGEFPTNFIIYRDGVGDAQRDQVLGSEIPQFEAAINQLYNKAAEKPKITVIVVNKRISQRFFVTDEKGRLTNPPSGCIIDRKLVETQDANSNKKFDFFMTPASTTQGCVLPTHFFVPKNDSELTRIEIEHLTFSLCHFYFNWAGPIKVPAPCQYAHKIAEFYMNIGANKKKQPTKCSREVVQAQEQCLKLVEPLNKKLHFL